MKLKEARQIALKYFDMLKPFTKRICIAGGIRREKPECHDIEIVAIPDSYKLQEALYDFQYKFSMHITKDGDKYKQIGLPGGINLDLFLCNETNFGNILIIRTGNAKFSKWLMGTKVKERGYIQKDGYLWKMDTTKRIDCQEEQDVFDVLGMDYIPPEKREY